jgi:hypothetical protein
LRTWRFSVGPWNTSRHRTLAMNYDLLANT